MTKTCTRCRVTKSLEAFARKGDRPRALCRACSTAIAAQWQRENRARHARNKAAWAARNPVKQAAQSSLRRAHVARATPKWADMDAIGRIYLEARERSRSTGIPHHVDHELPLNGIGVSGLHVPANLRVVTAAENTSRRNRLD